MKEELRESKSTKERIPIHTADQMDKMFAHFQRYGNINPGILKKAFLLQSSYNIDVGYRRISRLN